MQPLKVPGSSKMGFSTSSLFFVLWQLPRDGEYFKLSSKCVMILHSKLPLVLSLQNNDDKSEAAGNGFQ